MSTVVLRATGAATPEVVWERYADLDAWAQWSPQIRRVDASSRRLSPGMTGRVHGPVPISVRFSVDDVHADAGTWSWTVRLGPVRLRLQHGVSPEGEGSLTWLRVRGPSALVLAYAPVAQLALNRLVRP